jgi:hypothetical protein
VVFYFGAAINVPTKSIRKNPQGVVLLNMATYRLDRTAFKAHTVNEAADHASFYKKLDFIERLKVAAYLNSIAFNYSEDCPPKLDRTAFSVRSRSNG